MERTVEVSPVFGQIPVTLTYGDYRRVHGVMLPFKVASKTRQWGRIVTQFDSAKRLDELSDDAFRLTPPSKAGDPNK